MAEAGERSGLSGAMLVPAFVTIAVFVLLAAFVGHDPASGVTSSNSPFTDEAWNLLNARNFAVLGRWSVDDWNRQLISIPYSAIHAAVFVVAGPGIVQARLVEIAATALTAGSVAWGARRVAGPWSALLAGVAYGTSTLVLFHGRLALLEPLTGLGLAVGCVALAAGSDRRPTLAGIVAGLAFGVGIGTKAIAVPAVAGILVGTVVVAWSRPAMRRRWVVAVATLGLLGLGWCALALLPNLGVIAAVVSTLPAEPLPKGVGEALTAVRRFALNDGVRLAFPLLVAGGIGGVAAARAWPAASAPSRALLMGSVGWATAGIAVLALAPYSPNRYLEPMLPGLAILAGLGASAIGPAFAGATRTRARAVAYAGALSLVAIPGLVSYAGWMSATASTIPPAQSSFAALVPPGASVEGMYAPLFAMRTTGPTVFTNFGINPGDLYAARGVRWLVLADGEVPAWATLHPEAWAARQPLTKEAWGQTQVTLYTLP